MFFLAPAAKLFIAAILKDSIKAKVLAELRDAAEDPRSRVKHGFIDELADNWDDFWDGIAEGLKR